MIETTAMEQRVVRKNGLPAPLIPLERLAWNYWWSWAADGAGIFRDLDSEIWEECEHNPRQLLARTSAYRLAEAGSGYSPAIISSLQVISAYLLSLSDCFIATATFASDCVPMAGRKSTTAKR